MITSEQKKLLARVNAICSDDGCAEKAGAALAEMLLLRRDRVHRDRWPTTWGTKTNTGLARSVFAMLAQLK